MNDQYKSVGFRGWCYAQCFFCWVTGWFSAGESGISLQRFLDAANHPDILSYGRNTASLVDGYQIGLSMANLAIDEWESLNADEVDK